jgi:serine/threonine protein phosphatase PrpC
VDNSLFLLDSFGISDIGLVREHNEDAWAAYPDLGLFVLADGMGGHLGGEIAAKEAIEYFSMLFKSWRPAKHLTVHEIKDFFEQALIKVNYRIYEEGQQDVELKGMGTTLCVLYLYQDAAILAHVGDSRIYRMRSNDLQQLTEDHSLINEMIAIGAMQPGESETFPYKHILTRAIGTYPKVEPTLMFTDVEAGDLFMLCSDGLTNYVSMEQIEAVLQQQGLLSHKAQELVDLANELGGADNVSVVLINALPKSQEMSLTHFPDTQKDHDLPRQ